MEAYLHIALENSGRLTLIRHSAYHTVLHCNKLLVFAMLSIYICALSGIYNMLQLKATRVNCDVIESRRSWLRKSTKGDASAILSEDDSVLRCIPSLTRTISIRSAMVQTNGHTARSNGNGSSDTVSVDNEVEEITVFELELEDDGSPTKARSVSESVPKQVQYKANLRLACQYIRLPPPVKPYYLRMSIQAGSLASKSGVLHTNFPLDGSAFEREKFHEKM
jgi:hypothetical protein